MTYNEAYNKIIDAYFKSEIKILNSQFCFCGTLSPDFRWANKDRHKRIKYPYTLKEYGKMESALFSAFPEILSSAIGSAIAPTIIFNYEGKLFKGMSAALDVLKEIHKNRGEIIDEPIKFKKRDLLQV